MERPEVLRAGRDGFFLYMRAALYSARNLTNGEIPTEQLEFLARDAEEVAGKLVDLGLWEQSPSGYRIVDFLKVNPSAEEVEVRRAVRASAGRMGGRRSGEVRRTTDEASIKGNTEATAEATDEATDEANAKATDEANAKGNRTPYPGPGPGPVPVPVPVPEGGANAQASIGGAVDLIFDHYRERIQSAARICPRDKIKTRLKTFSADELCTAIDHFAANSWQMEHNAHRGAEWFFWTDRRIEGYLFEREQRNGNGDGRATLPERYPEEGKDLAELADRARAKRVAAAVR
jgi:hypothetical protein